MSQYTTSAVVQISLELSYICKIGKNIPTHTILYIYLKIENKSITPLMQNEFSNSLTVQLSFHKL